MKAQKHSQIEAISSGIQLWYVNSTTSERTRKPLDSGTALAGRPRATACHMSLVAFSLCASSLHFPFCPGVICRRRCRRPSAPPCPRSPVSPGLLRKVPASHGTGSAAGCPLVLGASCRTTTVISGGLVKRRSLDSDTYVPDRSIDRQINR